MTYRPRSEDVNVPGAEADDFTQLSGLKMKHTHWPWTSLGRVPGLLLMCTLKGSPQN